MPLVLLMKPRLSLGCWQISELQLFTLHEYLTQQIKYNSNSRKILEDPTFLQHVMEVKAFYLLTKNIVIMSPNGGNTHLLVCLMAQPLASLYLLPQPGDIRGSILLMKTLLASISSPFLQQHRIMHCQVQ